MRDRPKLPQMTGVREMHIIYGCGPSLLGSRRGCRRLGCSKGQAGGGGGVLELTGASQWRQQIHTGGGVLCTLLVSLYQPYTVSQSSVQHQWSVMLFSPSTDPGSPWSPSLQEVAADSQLQKWSWDRVPQMDVSFGWLSYDRGVLVFSYKL